MLDYKTLVQRIFFVLPLLFSFLYTCPVGTVIENTAQVSYITDNQKQEINSNSVKITKVQEQSQGQIELYKYSENSKKLLKSERTIFSSYKTNSGALVPIRPFMPPDKTKKITLNNLAIKKCTQFNLNEPTIIVLTNKSRNLNSKIYDSIYVKINNTNLDEEIIRLSESGINNGQFVGYIYTTNDMKKKSIVDGDIYADIGSDIRITEILSTTKNRKLYQKASRVFRVSNQMTLEEFDKIISQKTWIKSSFNKNVVSLGEHLKCTITLDDNDLDEIKIITKLPKGFSYKKNSLSNKNIIVKSTNSNTIEFKINKKIEKKIEFSYLIKVGLFQRKKALFSTWVQNNNKIVSNISNNILLIKKDLDRSKAVIFGKITGVDKKYLKGIKLYLENGISTITDKDGKYHFENVKADRHVIQIDTDSLDTKYKIKNKISQFVDLATGGIKRVDFAITKKRHQELNKKLKKDTKTFKIIAKRSPKMPEYTSIDIEKEKSKTKWIWPPKNYNPSIGSIKIAILHDKKDKLNLFLNNKPINLLNYDGKVNHPKSRSVISLYRGIDIMDGDNFFTAKIISPNGKINKILQHKVHLSTKPTIARIIEQQSFLVADGKNSPVIAVQLLDAQGYPSRDDMQGFFTIESPYFVQTDKEELNQNPISKINQKSKYIIHGDGITYIKLSPTTKSGEVKLHFNLQNRDEPLRAWLEPNPRDWLMVGFAEGTVGFNTIKNNLKNEKNDHNTYMDGRVSLFVKGKIKGDFLLTMAYDTGKQKDLEIFEQIDPNEYYTIYQDKSEQTHEAQSKRRVYLKIEKKKFYILFGDIKSDLQINELSRYKRNFNGIKSQFTDENYEYTAFISDTKNIFMKDEIQGDGTSGIYNLKNKDIVINSETLTIETRDRHREEKIIQKTTLNRYSDYSIDYSHGEIYFKEPIFSKDEFANPIFIVVDYEILGSGKSKYTYGGRGAIKLNKGKIEIGSTYIKEDNGQQNSQLIGSDTTFKIGKKIKIKGEYAKTTTQVKGQKIVQGDAFLLEAKYNSKTVQANAYIRQEKDAFGLNQQKQSSRHSRKSGFEATLNYWRYVAIKLLAYEDKDLQTNNIKSEAELIGLYKRKYLTAHGGFRFGEYNNQKNTQVIAGLTKNIYNNKISLKINHEKSIKHKSDQYPNRTIASATYSINSYIDLFLSHEISSGDLTKLNLNRLGIKSNPWKNAQITNNISAEKNNDAYNLYNNIGLIQRWQINKRFSVNGGIDRKRSIKGKDKNDNFTAYNTSASYNNNNYLYNTRVEYRNGNTENKVNIDLGVYTKVQKDLGVVFGIRSNSIQNKKNLQKELQSNFSFAYRPKKKWIVLNRFDFIHLNKSQDLTKKFINNLLLHYRIKDDLELSLQYGLKYIQEKVDNQTFNAIIDLLGIDVIYNINKKYEIGLHSSILNNYQSKQIDYALGLHVGYNVSKNSWLALGYNIKGFDDSDFSSQNSRINGPYLQIRVKFDQLSIKETLN